jgi:hypothetical protein
MPFHSGEDSDTIAAMNATHLRPLPGIRLAAPFPSARLAFRRPIVVAGHAEVHQRAFGTVSDSLD